MPRTLWFVAGAGAGVYAMTRARRLAESLTADGLRDRIEGLAAGARVFRDEVRAGAAEREVELRERYGVPAPWADRPSARGELDARPDEPARPPLPAPPDPRHSRAGDHP